MKVQTFFFLPFSLDLPSIHISLWAFSDAGSVLMQELVWIEIILRSFATVLLSGCATHRSPQAPIRKVSNAVIQQPEITVFPKIMHLWNFIMAPQSHNSPAFALAATLKRGNSFNSITQAGVAHCFCQKMHGYAPIYKDNKILHTFGLVGVNFQQFCTVFLYFLLVNEWMIKKKINKINTSAWPCSFHTFW